MPTITAPQWAPPTADSRRAFAERRFAHAWTPSRFDVTRAARVKALLRARPAGRVLDVGCYDGQFTAQVLDALGIFGVDVSTSALLAARARGVRPARAQLEAGLPFLGDAFATVLAAEIVEHVFDTQAVLDELARVVRPGGWLVLTTPNLVALSDRAQLVLG